MGVTSEREEETINRAHIARRLAKKWRERALQRKAEAGEFSLLLFVSVHGHFEYVFMLRGRS